ncbi:hypothetical protein [Alkalilimnicola sp. S0819]|uniref:hypothetical protein n=1 Tax=Alkalilimnicola sp. S0819 TaxID=2613922 RepID=UPI001261CE11|nr:hypothetical protein [Alkalilimnicola sp. S0819]KAB7624331.1 hypothetical protein F3N43_05855 [Alkalilimnicola sp. S0819]MPQ16156.1 hypothetical protein [Alkalilimnicola sp. S0819]
MAKSKKAKRFQYRYISDLGEGRTIEELLRQVLFDTHRTVADRWEKLGDDPDAQLHRFINTKRRAEGMVFGTLVLYETGRNREVLTLAEDQEELEIEQMAASKTQDGRPREFLEATLYFGASGNHLVLLQTTSLTGRELENHLRWLIDEEAQLLEPHERIVIKQGLSAKGTKALKQAKSVCVGAPVFEASTPRSAGGENRSSQPVRSVVAGRGRQWLESLFGSKELEALKLGQFADAEDLVVEVNIRRVGRASDDDQDPAQRAMEAVSTALRHQYPDDVEIETYRMGKVKGDELRLSKSVGIVHWNNVPDAEDVFHRMQDWLMDCLENGVIT